MLILKSSKTFIWLAFQDLLSQTLRGVSEFSRLKGRATVQHRHLLFLFTAAMLVTSILSLPDDVWRVQIPWPP